MNDFFDPEDNSSITNAKGIAAREETKQTNRNIDFEFALQPTMTNDYSTRQADNRGNAGAFDTSYGGLWDNTYSLNFSIKILTTEPEI